jgi:exopolyphosphatase/guanosine-5'-triphosphate,3'-diphosphate pyrophosphatase
MLRAAFDFGSGATKMCVAEVAGDGSVRRVLFAEEREVLLGHSFKASADGTIGADAARRLFVVVAEFKAVLAALAARDGGQAIECSGIATAVYREAANGPELLIQLGARFGIPSRVLPQDDEARVGFATGLALSRLRGDAPRALLVWDSGGSSFQLTLGTAPSAPLRILNGAWGSSKATIALARGVQRKSAQQSPNPVSRSDFAALRAVLEADLSRHVAGAGWLPAAMQRAEPPTVVALGGGTCAFYMCAKAVGTTDGVTEGAIARAATSLLDRDDAAIAQLGYPQPQMVLAKMALIATVMKLFGIPAFTFVKTTGNCLGMFASPSLWQVGQAKL